MKKILLIGLALSFCASDAGVWSSVKTKVKSAVKSVGSSTINVAKNEASKVYQEQKAQLTNQYLGPQQVASSLQAMISEINTIRSQYGNDQQIANVVSNLFVLLTNCYYNTSRVIVNISKIGQCIEQLASSKVNTATLTTNYNTLGNLISSYKNTYDVTLNSMITRLATLKTQTSEGDTRAQIIEQLNNLLSECTTDTLKVSINWETIYIYINNLQDSTLLQGFTTLVNLINFMQGASVNEITLNELKVSGTQATSNVLNHVTSEMSNEIARMIK